MRKFIKFLIGIGMLALIVGGIILGIAIKTKAFVVEEIVTKEYVFEEDFNKISVDIDIADLHFEIAEDSKCKVVCKEKEKNYHEVTVKDDKLNIKSIDTHKWYEQIFNFNWTWEDLTVTIYLPKTEYDTLDFKGSTGSLAIDNKFTFNTFKATCSTGSIKASANVVNSLDVSCSTGNINLSGMNLVNDFKVKASTGNIELNDIKCNNFDANLSTGEIKLDNVVAKGKLNISSSAGSVNAKNVDGDTISIKTSIGDIRLIVLTPKTFTATSSTGDVDVPNTTGGECLLKTSTGNISAEIK